MAMQVRTMSLGIALGALFAFTTLVAAQNTPERGGGSRGTLGGFGGIGLLRAESVQKELKITEQQKTKLQEMEERFRQARTKFMEQLKASDNLSIEELRKKRDADRVKMDQERQKRMEGMRKEIATILTSEQLKRWRQIELQQEGPTAMLRPEVAETIGLTAEQKAKLEQLNHDSQEKLRNLFQGIRRSDPKSRSEQFEQLRDKARSLREEEEKQAMALLSPEQKQKLGAMMGEPFPLERMMSMPRREGTWGSRSNSQSSQ